jgi:hypothetical protein
MYCDTTPIISGAWLSLTMVRRLGRRIWIALSCGLAALLVLPGLGGGASFPTSIASSATSSSHFSPSWGLGGHYWHNITALVALGPGIRNGSASAYDPVAGSVIVFGGLTPDGKVHGDSWKFHAHNWTKLNISPGAAPPPRAFASMTYDPRDQSVVLFGGLDSWPATNAGKMNDTWLFKNGHWKEVFPTTNPKARYAASMTYDARDKYVLLFGGNTTFGPYADTWTYSSGNWTKISTSPSPTPRYGAGMSYDWASGFVVMSNGRGLNSTGPSIYTHAWVYLAGTWKLLFTYISDPKPVYRLGGVIASSPNGTSNLTLLTGGSACPTCFPAYHLKNGNQFSAGQFDQMFFFEGYGVDLWASDYPLTPAVQLNTQFPVFVYDALAGCFVYFVEGQTWTFR